MHLHLIDDNGYYLHDIIREVTEESPLQENEIAIRPPQGLYRAKWTGTEWVETMTQEEIAALNVPSEPSEPEMIMLAIADLDAQREQDKIETQLAIAELAETLLGGV